MPGLSPAARALVALTAIQNTPGITATQLGDRLGVTERAARRYVAVLREADVPIESATGPYGGYRLGRGLRLPPLMLTAAEAMGLVMAVLEGHRGAADPADLVGGALAKILGVLPAAVAGPVRALRPEPARGDPAPVRGELVGELLAACSAARRLRLGYPVRGTEHAMLVDPWAVVLRHSRWYLLAWSHTRDAVRVLRVDRIRSLEQQPETFTPPERLDALRVLEEHLSQHWTYPVDVLIEASPAEAVGLLPRSLGRLEPDPADPARTRLRATTNNPRWYARQLAGLEAPFRVDGSPELKAALAALGRSLIEAAGDSKAG